MAIEPANMLYMPRSFVHEACTVGDDEHDGDGYDDSNSKSVRAPSLHLTILANKKRKWTDVLLATVQDAVWSAVSLHVAVRGTLSLRFADYTGAKYGRNDEHARAGNSA